MPCVIPPHDARLSREGPKQPPPVPESFGRKTDAQGPVLQVGVLNANQSGSNVPPGSFL